MPSQVDMMESELLLNYVKSVGLKVEENGHIIDENYEYGYITLTGLTTPDGMKYALSDILTIGYADAIHQMSVMLADGSEDTFLGRYTGGYVIVDDEEGHGFSETPRAIPTTLSEVYEVLPELFPGCEEKVYYNILTEKYFVNMSMFGEIPSEVPLDDRVLRLYRKTLEVRLKEHGFFGKRMPAKEVSEEALLLLMDEHSRNPFKEYVESRGWTDESGQFHLGWDGVPRLRMWFRDTFGATTNGALSPKDEIQYLGDVAQAWFIGAIGRMYGPYRHEIVPVFIGIQGIGKGHALEYTAGRSEFYTTTMVDPTAPGGIKEFLDAVRGRVLVELGEATQFKGDADRMKNFITQTYDQMRKPYRSMDEEYPRHFILASSSNFDNIFTDSSGNRRFFPMYCDPTHQTRIFSTEDRSEGQYDVDQLWAEALHMFRNGIKAFIYGEAEKRAAVMQKYCTSENSKMSIIDDALDDRNNIYWKKGSLVNKEIIMNVAFGITNRAQMLNKDVVAAFNEWADNMPSGVWKKREGVSINGGKPGRVYERLLEPGETPDNGGKFLMIPTKDTDGMADLVALSEIRRLTRDYLLFEGDIIPPEALATTEDLDLLLERGYVLDVGTQERPEYRVGVYKE